MIAIAIGCSLILVLALLLAILACYAHLRRSFETRLKKSLYIPPNSNRVKVIPSANVVQCLKTPK